jgi:hypothetical protein
MVYGVDINGAARAPVPLPDNVITFVSRNGSFWFVTAKLGEGIESPPTAPSELHRLRNGEDAVVARDALHVFVSVIGGPVNNLAFVTDDAQAFTAQAGDDGSRTALGKLRPLLFTPKGELIARDGFNLVLIDPGTGVRRTLGKLPEGAVSVFYLDEPLDRAP